MGVSAAAAAAALTCNQMPELSVVLMLWPFYVYIWTLSFVLILHKNSGCSMSTCADIFKKNVCVCVCALSASVVENRCACTGILLVCTQYILYDCVYSIVYIG